MRIESPIHSMVAEPSMHSGDGESIRNSHPASPASMSSSAGFPASSSTGRPTGLLSTLHASADAPKAVTLPGDSVTYYIKSPSNTSTPQSLYARDPDTGVLRQTAKQVAWNKSEGWKPDAGLKGGAPKLDPDQQAIIDQAQRRVDEAKANHNVAVSERDKAQRELDYINVLNDPALRGEPGWMAQASFDAMSMPGGIHGSAGQRHIATIKHRQEQIRHERISRNFPHLRRARGKERKQIEDALAAAQTNVDAAKTKLDEATRALDSLRSEYAKHLNSCSTA